MSFPLTSVFHCPPRCLSPLLELLWLSVPEEWDDCLEMQGVVSGTAAFQLELVSEADDIDLSDEPEV